MITGDSGEIAWTKNSLVLFVDESQHLTLKGIDFEGSLVFDTSLCDTSFMGTVVNMPPELF